MKPPAVVILAGGQGTRLSEISNGLPKILMSVNGKPLIDWKINSLIEQGVTSIYLLLGMGSERVSNYLETKNYSCRISTILDGPILLGTGGAIRNSLEVLPEYFVLTYGDNLLSEPISNFAETHESSFSNKLVVTTFTGIADQKNVEISENEIIKYSKNPFDSATHTDYGYTTFLKEDFYKYEVGSVFDLSVHLEYLISENKLKPHITSDRYYEIGTPATLLETSNWVSRKN
jgi:MurNAc alpha-1-phosphate uridylyltransferase